MQFKWWLNGSQKPFVIIYQLHVMPVRLQHVMPVRLQHVMAVRLQHVLAVRPQHVMPVRLQHVMPVRLQHVMPERLQHVMPVRLQHVMPVRLQHVMPVRLQANRAQPVKADYQSLNITSLGLIHIILIKCRFSIPEFYGGGGALYKKVLF